MKKIVSFSLFVFFLVGLITVPAISQTGAEITEKMIEAMGGRKALEGIKDMTISMTAELTSMGLSVTVITYSKEPNMGRSDVSVMGMEITNAFDGETAWSNNPQTGAIVDSPEEAQEYAKRENLGISSILHPEKFGITYSYKGKEKIENKDYIVFEQAFKDGFTSTMYLDSETYLPYKVVSKALNETMMEVDQELFSSDYKKVQGVMFAHTITLFQDSEEFMTATVTDMKINTGLEDSLFKK